MIAHGRFSCAAFRFIQLTGCSEHNDETDAGQTGQFFVEAQLPNCPPGGKPPDAGTGPVACLSSHQCFSALPHAAL